MHRNAKIEKYFNLDLRIAYHNIAFTRNWSRKQKATCILIYWLILRPQSFSYTQFISTKCIFHTLFQNHLALLFIFICDNKCKYSPSKLEKWMFLRISITKRTIQSPWVSYKLEKGTKDMKPETSYTCELIFEIET